MKSSHMYSSLYIKLSSLFLFSPLRIYFSNFIYICYYLYNTNFIDKIFKPNLNELQTMPKPVLYVKTNNSPRINKLRPHTLLILHIKIILNPSFIMSIMYADKLRDIVPSVPNKRHSYRIIEIVSGM